MRVIRPWAPALLVLVVLAAAGCGSSPSKLGADSAAGNAGAQNLGSGSSQSGHGSSGSSGNAKGSGSGSGSSGQQAAKGKSSKGSSAKSGAKGASPKAGSSTSSSSSQSGITSEIIPAGSGGTGNSGTIIPGSSLTDPGSGGNPNVNVGGATPKAGSTVPPSPEPNCDATLPPVKSVGITNVQTGRFDANGAIQPASTFSASTDRNIVAGVTLDPKIAVTGTVITYATIYGCGYEPSSSYTLPKPLTGFYVQFDASTTPFVVGVYHVRFFVNSVAAWDTSYTVTT